ncbi:MAG: hypothetical protein ACREBU_09640, partial [Nitrososphaera sp.]
MNEFDMMQKIIEKHTQVEQLRNVNDRLYEHLAASILYILRYADSNNILLPNRDALNRIIEITIHYVNDVNAVSERVAKVARTELSINATTNRTTNDEQPDSEHYQKRGSNPILSNLLIAIASSFSHC